MAQGFLGMSTQQARTYAGRIDTDARSVRDLVNQVGRMVGEVAWFGHNADLFRADWEQRLRPMLTMLADELEQSGHTLQRHAAAQEHVSNGH